ncbi:MAG: hypothetical protein IKR10_06085 [Firmicutes bacterium]|nr:hypothetical protein [Bacillota bacterium]
MIHAVVEKAVLQDHFFHRVFHLFHAQDEHLLRAAVDQHAVTVQGTDLEHAAACGERHQA